jgi:hypothetical protein
MATKNRRSVAPLYRVTFRLCEEVFQRWQHNRELLPRRICESSLRLLELVTLVLYESPAGEDAREADRVLVRLRQQVRLAMAVGAVEAGGSRGWQAWRV